MAESLRARAYRIVEETNEPAARLLDALTVVLIVLNVVAMAAATVPGMAVQYGRLFSRFEVFSVVVFSAEYLLRAWVCVEDPRARFHHPLRGRLRYLITPMAIIDLGAILPFYLRMFLTHDFRFLLLFRLLKLLRYVSALDMLVAVIRSERKTLVSAGLMMLVLLVTLSSIMYQLEHDVQPDKFSSIPDAMWWAVVTLTTVGYGDVVPVTPLGKVVGGVATVLGIGMFALPAGILASAFAQEVKKRDFVTTWNMVAKVPLFSGLKAGGIADIASLLRPHVASPGERLLRKGDPAHAMFFIVSGEVRVDAPMGPVLLRAGDFFGEIALLHATTRTATVAAVTSCQFLMLDAHDLSRLLQDEPELGQAIRDTARRRLDAVPGGRSPPG
jgi:voltage-gated potassium channel